MSPHCDANPRTDAARLRVVLDPLTDPRTHALLLLHLQGMQDTSPAGHVFALDLLGLQTPDVTVWSIWDGEAICSIGALKQLDDRAGEVKSMRTHPDHLRHGAGSMLLDHIIGEARRRGLARLSLETGSGSAFDAALALYRRRGFVVGDAFGGYVGSAFNQFLHLSL